MAKMALFVKVNAQPGKRDEVKKMWEKYVKPHSETQASLEICCYCYANENPDTICLFELISDPSDSEAVMKSDWFASYQESLKPLIKGPPEIITATPIWIK
jgi:quinol monooxygenase YgiN